MSAEMASAPPGGSELEDLSRRVMALEEELSQLQALVRES